MQRNRGLDVLRGLAILLVIVNHVEPYAVPSVPPLSGAAGAVYWRMKSLGWTGVDLFFVISGFLIGGLLFKELQRDGTIRFGRFWVRRAFKILPSYALLLVALAVTGATGWWVPEHPWRSLAVHGLFLQNYVEGGVNGPTWSLAVEEHFYALIPFLLGLAGMRVMRPGRGRTAFALAALAVLLVVPALRCVAIARGIAPEAYMLTHLRFDSLLLGVCCQWLVRIQSPLVARIRGAPRRSLAIAAALIAPAFALSRTAPAMFTVGFSTLAVAYGIVVLVVTDERATWPERAPMRAVAAVGRWSYNIYLWHFFLAALGVPGYAAAQGWIAAHVHNAVACVVAQGSLFAAIAIAIGWAMTRLVEDPLLALRDRLPWLGRPTEAKPAAPAAVAAPAEGAVRSAAG